MADTRLRQIEAFVEEIRREGMPLDVLRRGLEAALAAVMEAEVTELAGAGYGERSEARLTRRNGYRQRTFQTGLGDVGA